MTNKLNKKHNKVSIYSPSTTQKKVKGVERIRGTIKSSVERVKHAQTKVRLEMGQKVLLYTTDGRDIINIYGKSLGPKQVVLGSGYVSEREGTLFVNTENLGRVIITQERKAKKSDKRNMDDDAIYVKCIEE